MQINFKKLSSHAIIPTKAHIGDAGFDLYASFPNIHWPTRTILPNEICKIPTDIALEIPEGWCGIICDRSSLGSCGLKVMGGVIDSSFRGNIIVCLMNLSDNNVVIDNGFKVAQLLILPVPNVHLIETTDLSLTHRNTKGFGSTGQ